MQVEKSKVVSVVFELKDTSGKVLDKAEAAEPLVYLHGFSNIPAGLEKAIDGMKIGEKKQVHLEPADAFGDRDESKIEKVGRHRLDKKLKYKKGDVLRLQGEQGPVEAVIVAMTPVSVTLDYNHPLAGKALDCSLEVLAIRDATAEETQHGHVHGPEGHDHGHDDHDHDHDDHDHDHDHDHAGHHHHHK